MIRIAASLLCVVLLLPGCGGQAASSNGATALQVLNKAIPSLKQQQPRGVVESVVGDQNLDWRVRVWDPDRQNSTSYSVDSGGSVHATGTISGAHEVVSIVNLASDSNAPQNLIDSPDAMQRADQAGGAAFTQQTNVKMWSMQLGGQNGRLTWTVQYGQPTLTQQQRLTIVLDAASGSVLSQNRST